MPSLASCAIIERRLRSKLFFSSTAAAAEASTNLRNIGIIAHIDAGKTTTVERMLFHAGITRRIGNVDRGDTVMDYLPQERERGITITAAAITFPWRRHQVNLIDTPGHVDFGVEVERAMRVMDGAVCVLDGSAGVEAQTMAVWRQADRYAVPRIIFVNKLDKVGASMEETVKDVERRLGVKPLVCHWPVYDAKGRLDAIHNVLAMKTIRFLGEGGKEMQVTSEASTAKRALLLEQMAELDEQFFEEYLSEKVTAEGCRHALRRIALSGKACPVFCGSALRNVGIQCLLDAMVENLPSPKTGGPSLLALAFKAWHDDKRGLLVFVRLYDGCLEAKQAVYNANKGLYERAGKLYRVLADSFERVDCLRAGDIGIVVGLKATATCDTLVATKQDVPLQQGIAIPPPVFTCAVTTGSRADEEALQEHLQILQLEDPSIRISRNDQTGQTLLSGMGELHLDIVQHRMLNDWKAKVTFGDVQIAFQEVMRAESIEHEQKLDQEVNGERLQAEAKLALESVGAEAEFIPEGVCVEHCLTGDLSVAVQDLASKLKGPVGAHPLRALRVKVDRLAFPPSQTPAQNVLAARLVLAACFSRIFRNNIGQFCLAQPIMHLSITTPSEFVGSITSDFHSARHGRILRVVSDERSQCEVEAEAPLAHLLGYASRLRGLSGGMASFHMSIRGYQIVAGSEGKAPAGDVASEEEECGQLADDSPLVTK